MKYALMQLVLAQNTRMEIDRQRYNDIAKARFDLTDLTAIEEKFDIALENHYELEKEITAIAARDMMFSDATDISLWNLGNLLNRRVTNVLSSCRAYLDHTAHHLANIFGEGAQACINYKASRSKQYDSGYEFRIVEAMRNYGQHRGLPIHGWSLGCQKVYHKKEMGLEYRIGFKVSAKNLREDGKFNARALQDIDELGGSADLLAIVRGYIQALSKIHCDLRSELAERIDEVEDTLNKAVQDYRHLSNLSDPLTALAAVELTDEGIGVENHYIVQSTIEYRRSFLAKNQELVNFKVRHVSSRRSRDKEDK